MDRCPCWLVGDRLLSPSWHHPPWCGERRAHSCRSRPRSPGPILQAREQGRSPGCGHQRSLSTRTVLCTWGRGSKNPGRVRGRLGGCWGSGRESTQGQGQFQQLGPRVWPGSGAWWGWFPCPDHQGWERRPTSGAFRARNAQAGYGWGGPPSRRLSPRDPIPRDLEMTVRVGGQEGFMADLRIHLF